MEGLPREIIDQICAFLPLNDLKNTLTLSQSFQYASERASGAFAEFDLCKDNIQEFTTIYSGRRWGYLRHVRFRPYLPTYEEDDDRYKKVKKVKKVHAEGDGSRKAHYCRESLEELQERDELFTRQIYSVFTTLQALENRLSSGKLQLTIYTPVREVHATCPHRKFSSWRLHLLSPDKLPKLTSVQALCLEDEFSRDPLDSDKSLPKLDLRILIDLAIKFPRLEFLRCKIGAGGGWTTNLVSEAAPHFTRDWAGPHRDSRHNFAQILKSTVLPSTLRLAQLDFLYPLDDTKSIDESQEMPNLVRPAVHDPINSSLHDPFSSSLRLLSYQLRKLELKVVADSTLFWPTDGTASWPSLESIYILFHVSSPSGRWYFQGPKNYGRDTKGFEITDKSYPPLEDTSNDAMWDEYIEDYGFDIMTVDSLNFRVYPNDEVLVPFLTAFAKSASGMPVLKEACLWAPLKWDPCDLDSCKDYDAAQIAESPEKPLAWGITYVAPAASGFPPFLGLHQARQLWWTTAQWRPDFELRRLFQHIGDQNTELIEHWEQKFAYRTVFERCEIFSSRHPRSPWPLERARS